ncbi:hypothetical protein [Pseudovibrio sp. SPO723]|uniref:hypothetical protein n=1 Tax=Nesiotobacter zosterae TaxID=392721 RepID=UPI0029C1D3B3|nr:hypothetical protein [Pseudovibrio sp. SPO723]MDX5592535.1 hypothetical protein [Pseudovibrio sp. SPO723]
MKNWTIKEDLQLVAWFDFVGTVHLSRDLGRSDQSIKDRAKKLKETGAWDDLKAFKKAEFKHLQAYYEKVGNKSASEEIQMLHPFSPEHGMADEGDEA